MKRILTKQDLYQLNERIKREFRFPGHIKITSEVALIDSQIILVDNRPAWFYDDRGRLCPTLQVLLDYNFLPNVVVHDSFRSAVQTGKSIPVQKVIDCNDDIKKNDIVCILDKELQKPIGVGIALYNAKSIKEMKKGIVVKNTHHEKDKIWEMTWFI